MYLLMAVSIVLIVVPVVVGIGAFAVQWLDEEFFKYPIFNDPK